MHHSFGCATDFLVQLMEIPILEKRERLEMLPRHIKSLEVLQLGNITSLQHHYWHDSDALASRSISLTEASLKLIHTLPQKKSNCIHIVGEFVHKK